MIEINDLNTQKHLSATEKDYAFSRLGHFVHVARRVPAYLTDPELMDKLYPPHKLMSLDLECVRSTLGGLQEMREGGENYLEEAWDKLGECRREIDRNQFFVAVGVYYSDCSRAARICPEHGNLLSRGGPAIFITPERVESWVQGMKAKQHFKTLFAQIYYHELCHALVDDRSSKYKSDWGKVVEESICNAVAFSRFRTDPERAFLTKAITEQPTEYLGYTYFSDGFWGGPLAFISALKSLDPDDWFLWWDQWLHLVHRIRHLPPSLGYREFWQRWAHLGGRHHPMLLPFASRQPETAIGAARQWRDTGDAIPEFWKMIGLEVVKSVVE